jgi:toxin ParE1/3/4
MICKLAGSARRDLQEVSNFWTSQVGEEIALRVVSGVMETIITMSGQRRAGVAADQFGARVRKFPAGKYMVYYRPHVKGIEILHVFRGARDQKKAWKGSQAKSKRNVD